MIEVVFIYHVLFPSVSEADDNFNPFGLQESSEVASSEVEPSTEGSIDDGRICLIRKSYKFLWQFYNRLYKAFK